MKIGKLNINQIVVKKEDGELIVSITDENLIEKNGYSVEFETKQKSVIDRVLDILDRYYLWNLDEKGNYVTVGDEIKAEVLSLNEEQG